MIPYWFLFAVPAVAALRERSAHSMVAGRKPLFIGIALLFALIIGLRYEVGADWGNYLLYLYRAEFLSVWQVLGRSDPGYVLLNWVAVRTVGEIWAVNLLCGFVFAAGLVSFARTQPRPWLALLVAVPYLVIVVAMGYNRQAVAIGLSMLGLVALARGDGSTLKFVVWVGLAATFHRSAVLLIPLAAFASARGRVWTAVWIAAATGLFYLLFLEQSVDHFLNTYIDRQYGSEGAAIRVAMNALPAAIFLAARQRFILGRSERRLWTLMSLLALAFIVLLVVSPSSTAVDRMALYVIPLQIFVLSRLPDLFGGRNSGDITLGVIAYSAAVQFVWLNFAGHAQYWLPYKVYPVL